MSEDRALYPVLGAGREVVRSGARTRSDRVLGGALASELSGLALPLLQRRHLTPICSENRLAEMIENDTCLLLPSAHSGSCVNHVTQADDVTFEVRAKGQAML